MNRFYEELAGIYRLRVPFEAIYTSVFLIRLSTGPILVDCATTDTDVDTVILPALEEIGVSLSEIDGIVLTHRHGDHAGGLKRILEIVPDIDVIAHEGPIADGLFAYALPGHTEDCIGVLDMRTHTLISGDGLQGAGVDKYRCYTQNPRAYLETIAKIQKDKRIQNVLFSHAYEPWFADRILGRAAVLDCLTACLKYIER